MSVRLRFRAGVNPPTPQFDELRHDALVTFVPLEGVWPRGLDTSRTAFKDAVTSGYTRFVDGDIVVPKITPTFQADRTTIASGLVGGVGAGTTELHVVRCGPACDARYVRHLLSTKPFLSGGEAELVGVAGQKRVPDTWLRDFRLPVEPLHKQRAIADYLDAETSRIDTLITRKLRMMVMLEAREKAHASTLVFGRGQGPPMVEDPVLGPIPRKWRRMRLRHCVKVTVGVVVNPSSYFTDDGVPFIHGSDVRDGWIDTTNLKYLSPESNELLSKSRLKAGDVVVVRAGYPGRAAVVPQELDGSNCASILILRQAPRLRPDYLAHFLNTREARIQVGLAQYGAAQEQINVSDIVDFVCPVPPLEEQDEIVLLVGAEASRHQRLRAGLERQCELLAEHRQALITAAVTGEIDIPGTAA